MRAILFATVISTFCAGVAIAETGSACLAYEPATVTLTGTLRRHTFPGPPNYEDTRSGDRAEAGYYLHLSAPVCTLPGNDFEALAGVRLVQLVLDGAGYRNLRPQLGKAVALTGTLFAVSLRWH